MAPGRPLKRPSDARDSLGPGGPGPGSPSGPKPKQARTERGPDDFSNVVKSKLQSYTRTGQACDRCKVRKIRCDALPEGCSHCIHQNLECWVTDRVSGRTERRGYLQQLEGEKQGMVAHIADLEKLLQSNGIEVRPWDWAQYGQAYPPGLSFDSMGRPLQDPNAKDQWTQSGSLWIKSSQERTPDLSSAYSRTPSFETRPTAGYLGVHTDSEPTSSIKGTKLSILGTTIDTTSFDAPDMDEPPAGTPLGSPLYNKSLAAFLQSVLGINPKREIVELPSKATALNYTEWYFVMVHPFMPILHKPSFVALLNRVLDDAKFKPTTCELVTLHMAFATIYFQYGVRSSHDPEKQVLFNTLSNKHYHWALSKFYDLMLDQSVLAVQALTMIALHARNFPKPACSCKIVNLALSRAIEMNLHRAAKLPNGGGTNIDNEIRKRIWWSILGLAVTLNGRLGRPMPITVDDFDVEFPLAISDQYLTNEGVTDPSKIGQCEFMVGLTTFRMVPLYLEMFSNIYSVRRDPTKYVGVVRRLEYAMQAVQNNLPDNVNIEKCNPSDEMFALYTQALGLEFYLCLRHPSVCMTNDAKFCAENMRICEESAKKLLDVVTTLLELQCLDTTWYQFSVYVAAIFSSLAAHWERRFNTNPNEISTLRNDMKKWMKVVEEFSKTLGNGNRMSSEIGGITDRTVGWIEHDMNNMDRKQGSLPTQQVSIQGTAPQPSFEQNGLQTTAIKHDHDEQQDIGGLSSVNGCGSSDQDRNSMANNNGGSGSSNNNNTGYYDGDMNGSVGADYTITTGYPDQSTAVSHTASNGSLTGAGGYDTNANAEYLYVQVASTGQGSGVNQSGEAPNPLIAFASQAAAQVGAGQPSSGVAEWRQPQASLVAAAEAAQAAQVQAQVQAQGGTSWADWTAAITDTQTERYSANALLNLGAGRPGDGNTGAGPNGGISVSSVPGDMGLVGAPGPSQHSLQWPLALFHEGNGTVGGT